MLEKAIQIAINAHSGQVDKGSSPYILHLIRVMNAGTTTEEKICGMLHDLVEDTDWTFEQLRNEGFDERIIEALKCLTKNEGEGYDSFIQRVITNSIAIKVKLNDLQDNMDIRRLSEITEKDRERLNKYLRAYKYLKSIS
ncbi:phosphohydrolase [Bergeyella cardium]|uniref:Phosphohydrolase n=1 Tax=Bergeyella cardium TaxID=1585976 RepID=A0A6P1QUC4_9FLAO|nr:phosphohydrolase [Bergeyella cardium]QHN65742.1 phosphohydrolase [Bergeyella cardium]WHE33332.1 phosphohydrolase [Bergeyella cardium]WHF59981.1 phosphohydrolase [Bergeyella cardium]